MARGGYRPGGGRPKGSKNRKTLDKTAALPPDIKRAARKANQDPLDYMLGVMNDPKADPSRRDRMAIAAAPFKHSRLSDRPASKKDEADAAARSIGRDSDWGDDLAVPGARPN